MSHHNLELLANSVLAKLLAGDNPVLAELRQQADAARIVDIECTGIGFFAKLDVPQTISRIDSNPSFSFGDVIADIPGLVNGASFVLFISEGQLDLLEGFGFGGESWPNDFKTFDLHYVVDGKSSAVRSVLALEHDPDGPK